MRILLILFLLCTSFVSAQNELLAKNYFERGEFEKALTLYQSLNEQNPYRIEFFLSLVATYQQLEKLSEAEKLLKDKLGNGKNFPQLYIELGNNYALQSKEAEAKENYNLAIEAISENPNFAYNIGIAFEKYSLLDEAIATYEKAMQLNDRMDFNVQLGRIYGEQGELEKMFNSYIDLIEKNAGFKDVAQRYFSVYITEDPLNSANRILKNLLLLRSQNKPDIQYNELLSWLFIQQKEYKKAFTQEKAVYKRSNGELTGITDLAYIAISDEDYESAREIVNFIITYSYTPESRLQGYQILMKTELKAASEIAEDKRAQRYSEIELQFEELLEEFGTGTQTYQLQIDYNHFLAFQRNRKENAIQNLKKLIDQNLTTYQEARVKMELADILVLDEKFNESLIYYSQIQKKIQNDILAQEARYKIARTSYYKGDFEWAQVQLDVLKKSTSQLMANDAMQLSLMIHDNSLEDSTQTALKKYAKADLLAFQDKNTASIAVLEDLLTNNKGEKIEDEALLKQGKLYEKTGQFKKAEANYLKIIQFFKDDILADDAYFKLATLYENKLNEPEKAKEQYEQIIFNHSDSIYFVEARKKYRTLRGDAIN